MSLANKFGIPQSLFDASKKMLEESNEYQKKVQAHMAKKGIKSLNDLTGDQKKKFFNDLDAIHTAKHEEVESVEEGSEVKPKPSRLAPAVRISNHSLLKPVTGPNKLKGYVPYEKEPSKAKNEEVELDEGYEKVVLNFLKKHGISASFDSGKLVVDKEDVAKAKKALAKADGFDASKLKVVSEVEEAESHQSKTTMKHISNPTEGEKKAAKDIKPGVAGYRDRVAMLKSAEARGALKKEEVELTQEDLDFIASLNQDEVAEGQLRNFSPHSDLAGRGRLSGYNTTAAGKKREADRETERLKDKMKFTKSQGGIAGPKGKLPEEVELDEGSGPKEKQHDRYVDRDSEESKEKVKGARERMASDEKAKAGKKLLDKIKLKKEDVSLEDFTVEEIEEYMQTEEFSQLDELSKDTLASYIKKRTNDVATQGALTRKHAMDAEAKKKEHGGYTTKTVRDLDDKANRAFMKGWKHRENIGKAVDRLTKG